MKHLLVLTLVLSACAAEVEQHPIGQDTFVDGPEADSGTPEVGVTVAPLFGLPPNSYCSFPRKCITLHVRDMPCNRGADLLNHTRAALCSGVFLWMRGKGDFWFPKKIDTKLVDASTNDTATIGAASTDASGWRVRTVSMGGFANFKVYYPPSGDSYGYNVDLCSGSQDPSILFRTNGGHPPVSPDEIEVCWGY